MISCYVLFYCGFAYIDSNTKNRHISFNFALALHRRYVNVKFGFPICVKNASKNCLPYFVNSVLLYTLHT